MKTFVGILILTVMCLGLYGKAPTKAISILFVIAQIVCVFTLYGVDKAREHTVTGVAIFALSAIMSALVYLFMADITVPKLLGFYVVNLVGSILCLYFFED